ncbi:MAG: hypothetical protein CL477_10400 [Acidobacteria bacterium]|jgi:hypothetical protein|nr:hypothetical protein [Acidobacteriota bacterium]MDP7479546.1 hypothetical protein [Vicinamibacterales bacterium]MDP7691044.1 hypothetical protein [Vicinamibacterales bacterium]HJN44548.1 hypothetical protein [Vicinamibacterales bacterium]|tara:strand:+ start:629 stop:1237 length:609 start_codon:yes stop_codon:yes gene_type:complete
MRRRLAVVGAAGGIGLATLVANGMQAADSLTSDDGAKLEEKLVSILRHADTAEPEEQITSLLEGEINAYLRFQGAARLPIGLTEPKLQIGEGGIVSAEAVVDLNLIREQRARDWLDPLQYLAGRLPVTASGRIRSGDGLAEVDIESVTLAGVPVPVQVLQELVGYYTRTPDHPNGTRLDEPISLPYRIAELRLSPGRAIIVQ